MTDADFLEGIARLRTPGGGKFTAYLHGPFGAVRYEYRTVGGQEGHVEKMIPLQQAAGAQILEACRQLYGEGNARAFDAANQEFLGAKSSRRLGFYGLEQPADEGRVL